MNMGADESKAHFDELAYNIRPEDLLVVIAWGWELNSGRSWPAVREIFVARALPIAQFRDALHLARGGTFVDRTALPRKVLGRELSSPRRTTERERETRTLDRPGVTASVCQGVARC